MKKILLSILTIAITGTMAFAATNAFFSDSETSEGNTFTAGSLDLKIANTHSVSNGVVDGTTNWTLDDVGTKMYFNFSDIKPGDWGENTISYQTPNPAWMCVNIQTADTDETLTTPESNALDTIDAGELGRFLSFIWWVDDGDNNLETDEQVLYGGPLTLATMVQKNPAGNGDGSLDLTIADSVHNMKTGVPTGTPVDTTLQHLAVGWCLGDITSNAGTGVGFTCSGTNVTNIAQSDKITGTVTFTADQARNNPDFLCPEHE